MPLKPAEVNVWWKRHTETLQSLKLGLTLKNPTVDFDPDFPGIQNVGFLPPILFNDIIKVDLFYQSVSLNGKKRKVQWIESKVSKTIESVGGINETIGFITLSDTENLVDGDLLKIEQELVEIIDTSGSPVVTVYRGVHGTLPVAHVHGETCKKMICSVPYNIKILNGKPDALDPPLNLHCTGVIGGILCTWDHYTEIDRKLFSYFKLYRRETLADFPDPPDFALAEVVDELAENSYFDVSVTELISYTYWVTGVDTSGNESDPSSPDSATPLSVGVYKVPDDLECIAIPNGWDILFGCLAWKYNAGIDEAEFRAKFYPAPGSPPQFVDLRTVAEGGTFTNNDTDQLIRTGVGATYAGANFSWMSPSAGTWLYAFRLKNAAGWSVWSDGNDTPQHVKDFVSTDADADTGPPEDWYSKMELGPIPNTIVVRTTRPAINGNRLWFLGWQIKDISTGAWYDPDANTGAAVTYYDGSAISHSITQGIDGNLRFARNTGSGFGTAEVGDMWMLDVREGTGLFAAHHCIWGLIDRFQNDDPANAVWFETDVPFHGFYVGNDWRLKIVKPIWEYSTDGYFGMSGCMDMFPMPYEYGGDTETYEFVSRPIPIPVGQNLDNLGVRAFFQNGYSRSDDDQYDVGVTPYTLEEGPFVLGITIDGGGSVPSSGVMGFLRVPFDCRINHWTILADAAGSIVIDVWKDTYANFPPTNADSITGATPPTLTTQNKNESANLSGWTIDLNDGDVLAFNVDSVSILWRAHLQLHVSKR